MAEHTSSSGTSHGGGGGSIGTSVHVSPSNTSHGGTGGSFAVSSTQLQKILDFAESQRYSTKWHGRCQAYVWNCLATGLGQDLVACPSAKDAKNKYMKAGTSEDLTPPAGAACYFNGDGSDGAKYGHTALSAGGGYIYDPSTYIQKIKLTKYMHNGYIGWGWYANKIPTGTSYTDSNSAAYSKGSYGSAGVTSGETESKDITTVIIKSTQGSTGKRASAQIIDIIEQNGSQILIQHGEYVYLPCLTSEITFTSERGASCGSLKFSCIKDDTLIIDNGDAVAFRYNKNAIFFGYIFSFNGDSDNSPVINVTCYDQLRYFKNKDSFVYNSRYSDLVKNICSKYDLKIGTIEDTKYTIPTRIEENTLLDICGNAADQTLINTGQLYVLYDNFGQICLKNIAEMKTNILIDKDTSGKYTWSTSIDSDVYNKVILARDNSNTGARELFIANNSANQAKWGILQLYDKGDKDDSDTLLKEKAAALLKYYNRSKKIINISDCLGHSSLIGGNSIIVALQTPLGKIQNYMVIEKVTHKFKQREHLMDLSLWGGEFTT